MSAERIDWDERALIEATRRWDIRRHLHDSWDAVAMQAAFKIGSTWQRERLRSEDAVERMARAMFEHTYRNSPAITWEKSPTVTQMGYRDLARAAIAALLGDDARYQPGGVPRSHSESGDRR